MKLSIIIGLALILGGGVSYAAESAIPGDLLYPIKVSVNERIKQAFTFGDINTVTYNVDLLEERLSEVDKLVADGTLSPEEAAKAQSAIVAQITKTKAALSDAGSRDLTPAERAQIASALGRLKDALQKYSDSFSKLEETAGRGQGSLKRSSGNGHSIVEEQIADITVDIQEQFDIDDSEIPTEDSSEETSDESEDGSDADGDEGTDIDQNDGETVDGEVNIEADLEIGDTSSSTEEETQL